MGFLRNTKSSLISDYFKLVEDLGSVKAGTACNLALYDDHIKIQAPFSKQEVKLVYSKINDVFHGKKTELVESNKSVLGRALVGGALFGGAGAVVGAVSGSGKKERHDTRLYLIISYTNSKGIEELLQFEDTRKYKGKKIAKMLRELCSCEDEANSDQIIL